MRMIRHAIVVVLTAGVTAACGGATGAGTTSDGPLSPLDSPLAGFLGVDGFAFGDNEAFAEQQRKAEQTIRDCMIAEGFSYTPSPLPDFGSALQAQFDDPVGYARENGFNIVAGENPFAALFENPNAEYLATLDDAGREAWEAALSGSFDPNGEGGFGFDPSKLGCQGLAFAEILGGEIGDLLNDPALEAFGELVEETTAAAERDPRLGPVQERYETCMDERGHGGITSEDEAQDAVRERLPDDAVVLPEFGGGFGQGIESEAFDPTYGLDPDELAEIRSFEIDIAVAHAECAAELVQTELTIQFEAEQAIIDDPNNTRVLEKVKTLFEAFAG